MASLIAEMSSGVVTKTETSSANATTAVFCCRPWTRIPLICCSRLCIGGFRHKTNSNVLNGHPCRTEQCIKMGPEICPFIWTTDVALSCICFMRSMKTSPKPYLCKIVKRHVCDIISNAYLKYSDRTHRGFMPPPHKLSHLSRS